MRGLSIATFDYPMEFVMKNGDGSSTTHQHGNGSKIRTSPMLRAFILRITVGWICSAL